MKTSGERTNSAVRHHLCSATWRVGGVPGGTANVHGVTKRYAFVGLRVDDYSSPRWRCQDNEKPQSPPAGLLCKNKTEVPVFLPAASSVATRSQHRPYSVMRWRSQQTMRGPNRGQKCSTTLRFAVQRQSGMQTYIRSTTWFRGLTRISKNRLSCSCCC